MSQPNSLLPCTYKKHGAKEVITIFLFRSSNKQSNEMVDAGTLEKLEAGFAKLQAATDCKSLLKKYLTKDVFDSLKTKKTSFGSTLLDVIQSGE